MHFFQLAHCPANLLITTLVLHKHLYTVLLNFLQRANFADGGLRSAYGPELAFTASTSVPSSKQVGMTVRSTASHFANARYNSIENPKNRIQRIGLTCRNPEGNSVPVPRVVNAQHSYSPIRPTCCG